ncbi:hypothetical protein D1BOALGB6SA_1382 [Olavius sp. associated proteobacterium Delta 1]|nr:hypothetical protein D1BOALGB6SA_1382 [Olavius sp. associated proteobacterium Delta 1]
MTKKFRTIILGVSILALMGMINLVAVDIAGACGWGQSGGSGYVPQRRDSGELLAKKSAVSEDQAREIVTSYVKRLNPNLAIGKVQDNGGFYAVEIVDEGLEIVQLLGVDKRSGRLILLN